MYYTFLYWQLINEASREKVVIRGIASHNPPLVEKCCKTRGGFMARPKILKIFRRLRRRFTPFLHVYNTFISFRNVFYNMARRRRKIFRFLAPNTLGNNDFRRVLDPQTPKIFPVPGSQ